MKCFALIITDIISFIQTIFKIKCYQIFVTCEKGISVTKETELYDLPVTSVNAIMLPWTVVIAHFTRDIH